MTFAEHNSGTAPALDHWYRMIKQAEINNFAELKALFPTADQVNKMIVFNVGGNKIRLICKIRYNSRTVYVLHVLTHIEYDKGKWKD